MWRIDCFKTVKGAIPIQYPFNKQNDLESGLEDAYKDKELLEFSQYSWRESVCIFYSITLVLY